MGAEATIMMISMITMNSPGSPSMQRQLFAVSNGCQVIMMMMVMMMMVMMTILMMILTMMMTMMMMMRAKKCNDSV